MTHSGIQTQHLWLANGDAQTYAIIKVLSVLQYART